MNIWDIVALITVLSVASYLTVLSLEWCARGSRGPKLCQTLGSYVLASRMRHIASHEIPLIVATVHLFLGAALPELSGLAQVLPQEMLGFVFVVSPVTMVLRPTLVYVNIAFAHKQSMVRRAQESIGNNSRNFERALDRAYSYPDEFATLLRRAFESFEIEDTGRHGIGGRPVWEDYERSKAFLLARDDPVALAFRTALSEWKSSHSPP